jgi:hypothetical protein
MRKTAIIVAIAALAMILAALCTTASAGDYGSGCPYSNFYNGTLENGGGVYFDVKGYYDSAGATQSYTFENVPDGRQVVRMYPGIWLGSPSPGRVTEWSIEINEHTDYFNFTEPGSLPFCNLDCPPEDGTGEHCTVSCSGYGVCSVTYNANPYVVTGDNNVTYWTSEQIYQVGLLAVYENESMEKLQYWVKEGHENPDTAPYHVYFNETGNTGPIDTGNISTVEYYSYGYPNCLGASGWPDLNENYIGSPNITKTNGYAPVFYGWTDIPPAYIDAPDNCFLYPALDNDRMMVPVLGIHYSEGGGDEDLEFGDAPDNSSDPTDYPSLLASNGVRHTPTDTECLGLNINGTDWKDFEPDANVPGPDLFDDGLLTFVLAANNSTQTVDVEVTNLIPGDQTLILNILLDLNQDGDWNDTVGSQSEHVVRNQPIPLTGVADGTFTSTPFSTVGATPGPTRMRITLTRHQINPGWNGTMASAGYGGPFECGETEDWSVSIDSGAGGTCGDVDGIPGVTMNDGRQIFMNIIYGSAQYPISDSSAADCDGRCVGMKMNDGRQIYMNIIHGPVQYPLNCTCP